MPYKKANHRWQWPTIAVSLPAKTKPDNTGLASNLGDIVKLWRELGYNVTTKPMPTKPTHKQHAILWIVLAIVFGGVGLVFVLCLLAIFALAVTTKQ